MAYRVKGYLTKGERDRLEDFIRTYHTLVNNESLPQTLRETVKCVYCYLTLLARFALEADNIAIVNKIVAPGLTSKPVPGKEALL